MTSDLELKLAYLEGKRDAYTTLVGRVDPEMDEMMEQYVTKLEFHIMELMKEIDKHNN